MKKLNHPNSFFAFGILACLCLGAFTFAVQPKKLSKTPFAGWGKIASVSLDSKKTSVSIDLLGKADACSSIKFIVRYSPVNLRETYLSYNLGNEQDVLLQANLQPNGESKAIALLPEIVPVGENRGMYQDQSGNCWCERKIADGGDFICHKTGTGGGSCSGCACSIPMSDFEEISTRSGQAVHRNLTGVRVEYSIQGATLAKTKAPVIEVWGYVSGMK